MAESPKMSLKLLIDKKSNKVIFAESGKQFVDFLFHLLNLPVGTVIRLLTTGGMVGSFGNLYKSVEKLSDVYMQPNKDKQSLLKPAVVSDANVAHPLLTVDVASPIKQLYSCQNRHRFVSHDPHAKCGQCGYTMAYTVSYVSNNAQKDGWEENGTGGYVKSVNFMCNFAE